MDDLKDGIASAKVWALVLYIAPAGSLFGAMTRGFGWRIVGDRAIRVSAEG